MILNILLHILLVAMLVLVYYQIGKIVNVAFCDKREWFLIFLWPIFIPAYIAMRISTKLLGWKIN